MTLVIYMRPITNRPPAKAVNDDDVGGVPSELVTSIGLHTTVREFNGE